MSATELTAAAPASPRPRASTARPAPALSPFVPMPKWSRAGILWLAGAYAGVVSLGPFFISQGNDAAVLLSISTVVYLVALLYPVAKFRNDYGWFHPLVFSSLFAFVNVVLRKTGLFLTGMEEHVALPGLSRNELTMLVAYENLCNTVALAATYLGFFLGPRFRPPRLKFGSARTLPVILAITMAAACFAVFKFFGLSGGMYGHIMNLARGTAGREYDMEVAGIGQFEMTITMAVPAALIYLAYQRGSLMKPMLWAMTGASLFLSFMATGRRSSIVYPTLMGMMVWMMSRRKIPYVRLAVALGFSLFLFGLVGIWRSTVWKSGNLDKAFAAEYSATDVFDFGLQEIQSRSGSSASIYPVLAHVPAEVDFLYGQSYVQNFLRFIPRVFWPDKPRGIDVTVAQTFYGVNWAIPLGAVGEAYWNFHLPGIMVVFFLFGAFLAWLGRLLERYPTEPSIISIYALTLFLLTPSQTGFKNWLFAIVPALVILRLANCVRFASGR